MAADILFKYEWLWGNYTADVTFTKKLLGETPVHAASVLPGAYKTIGSRVWSGTYTKKYSGPTTYAIIQDVMRDIKIISDSYAQRNFDSAEGAVGRAQKSSRPVNVSATFEVGRQYHKAALAYMLTNFCGYKKTITLTSGRKGSLRAQTRRNGWIGSKKLITPGREGTCDLLDRAYRANPQYYPQHKALMDQIEDKKVAGKLYNNNKEYVDLFYKGASSNWVIPTTGGTRRGRKNRK